MKKFLSLILALLMTVSCASVAFANEDAALDGADTAVEETPYDDAMQYLYAVGIFKGYTEDGQMLGAADPIQRYQMALLAARIATGWLDDDTWLNGNANDTEFTDLQGDVEEKYLGALSYAAQMGLIEGYGDGTFKPYDGITYRDVLTIACRLIGYKNLKYPWGFIEKAVNLGLTEGIEDVAYTEPLTRGGVAQV
ncbi:MAG: S-layer homology domain-containing protein, partial [Ruminococcaceae bacterium]|nr:S-layer homology domain-containing protein [Oscillospiraceae bacterium]